VIPSDLIKPTAAMEFSPRVIFFTEPNSR